MMLSIGSMSLGSALDSIALKSPVFTHPTFSPPFTIVRRTGFTLRADALW